MTTEKLDWTKPQSWVALGLVLTIIFVPGIWCYRSCSQIDSSVKYHRELPDPAKQEERNAFIAKLISQGIFQKVEVIGDRPHLWVTPKFMALSFDAKKAFVSVVSAYYAEGNTDDPSFGAVTIQHSITGKIVGYYYPNLGGLDLE